MKYLLEQFVFWRECKKYNISLWACPNFLFIVIGAITIVAMVVTYIIGKELTSAEFLVPAVAFVTVIIFAPGAMIVRSFDRMAEANRLKTEFISIASHQLRGPLSAIKWVINILESEKAGDLEKDQKEYVELLKENNQEMLTLVNDLLNVSRLEGGELTLKEEEINIYEVAKEAVDDIHPLAERNEITLEFQKPKESMPKVIGDEVHIGMVVKSLVDNAIKYSEKGDTVKISFVNKGSSVRFRVEDEGLGIPKKEQKQVFSRFFRSSNAARHQIHGTGLGLFISQSIIQQLDGEIGFKSKEGEGSTFWFELPAARS